MKVSEMVQADANADASSEKVTRTVEQWTDAEVLCAVRNGTHALVPIGGGFEIGAFDLDTWEGFEGSKGLMVELTREECRFVAPQMFGVPMNFSNDAERTDVSLNQPSNPSASTLAKEQEHSDAS